LESLDSSGVRNVEVRDSIPLCSTIFRAAPGGSVFSRPEQKPRSSDGMALLAKIERDPDAAHLPK
jgi:hypothetical protein